MTNDKLRDLARQGALTRLIELRAELAEIQSEFPDLVSHAGRLIRRRQRNGQPAGDTPTRKRRTMSAAARKAISRAQKARWAKLRKAKG